MKKRIELTGDSDQKFTQVANALTRMSRKVQKSVVVIYPPIPVSAYANVPAEGGFLFAHVAAHKGRFDTINLMGEVSGDQPVTIRVAHKSSAGIDAYDRMLEKSVKHTTVDNGFDLNPGDVILFSTPNGEGTLTEVRMFASFSPENRGYDRDTVVIDELDKKGDEILLEIEETPDA